MPGGRIPQAAYVEDWDEEGGIVPDSRHSANATANSAIKISSRLAQRFPAEPLIDGASDSGYSSRTAATGTSTQSGPLGERSPPGPHKLDMPKHRNDLVRTSSSRRPRKDKERERLRPEHVDQPTGIPSHHHAHVQQSSRPHRTRESAQIAEHYPPPERYYEDSVRYHQQQPSTPVERQFGMDFAAPYFAHPPVPDYPPAEYHRYPHAIEEVHRPVGRSNRSNSYQMYHQGRPASMHAGMMAHSPAPGYLPHHQGSYYEHGHPAAAAAAASSTAYVHPYASSPYAGSYYGGSEYGHPSDYPPERSRSRTRERPPTQSRPRRSSSIYGGPPQVDHDIFPPWFDEQEDSYFPEPNQRNAPRERRSRDIPWENLREPQYDDPRGRVPKPHRDDDRYKMPPPPPPPPSHLKHKAQVHQARRPERPELPRKAHTTQVAPPAPRRQSRASMDMREMVAALPEPSRRASRDTRLPQLRYNSLRESRRPTSYYDSARGAQVAVASSRRRRREQYYSEEEEEDEEEEEEEEDEEEVEDHIPVPVDGLERREREVERYQAQQSGRTKTMPASSEALLTKKAIGAGSDNASQKSGSNSSRGSGSGNGDGKNMNLLVNGLTIGFTEESVAGKNIKIQAGDTGRVQLSIAGERRPKQYHGTGSSYSDQTGRSARREPTEVPRRPRDDRRSEKASRRLSQSTYGESRRFAR
ncbi:hypothetical protein N7539_004612 [Penicillium diatomitis]|uniref:Uncharacterized protein n=1 Tax=Penicillium diatomitis TaxID=2819901 RepID=A0A9W9XEC5_9EURO|nr:uncharacterized protein N7539_004612 [Penicillium diatomitis]KAJ5489722.1 hypothetical protein N7539_004612 [Penicillium diatomitis]